jgi:N-acetylglutamate synthase-like GNAT family acetyltransferase
VTTRAESLPVPALEFGEKEFYLDEFHSHTLCFAVSLRDCERPGGFESLGRVLRDLIANETRVIVLIGVPERGRDLPAELGRVRRRLQRLVLTEETARRFPAVRGRRSASESFVDLSRRRVGADDLAASLTLSWLTLRKQPLLVGLVEEGRLVDLAQRLAGRLRVHKLVLVQPDGGITSAAGTPLSFMDETMLTAVLQPGQAEWAGLAARRDTLDAVRAALLAGVHAVNLCALDGLARELYTYEGSGTLFTCEDYCRIQRLGIDDFEEVERLIARGQREGYLKPRSPAEVARILINGFGAEIGSHHFAGVCGLEIEAYRAERVGEIVGLYTITRFKGESVGQRLVECVLEEARTLELRYVFACTVDERAQAFFERHGFTSVSPDDVPAAKWVGYERQRRARLKVLRYDLEPARE